MDPQSFSTPNELQQQLGERLKRLRLNRNLDQRTTAEKAGISEKALRNLEAGRGSTVATLLRVLKALDSLHGIDLLAREALPGDRPPARDRHRPHSKHHRPPRSVRIPPRL